MTPKLILLYSLAFEKFETDSVEAAELYFDLIYKNSNINYKDPTMRLLQHLVDNVLRSNKTFTYTGHKGIKIIGQYFKRIPFGVVNLSPMNIPNANGSIIERNVFHGIQELLLADEVFPEIRCLYYLLLKNVTKWDKDDSALNIYERIKKRFNKRYIRKLKKKQLEISEIMSELEERSASYL